MDDAIPSRLAVLEQIARTTEAALSELRTDMRGIQTEMRNQFRWMLGTVLLVLISQTALWFRMGTLTSEVAQIAALLRQHVGG